MKFVIHKFLLSMISDLFIEPPFLSNQKPASMIAGRKINGKENIKLDDGCKG